MQKNHDLNFIEIYRGIRKENDGLELKYRFGFAYIYMKETHIDLKFY